MPEPEPTIINRPEIDPVTNKPRWNLIAREIGGVVVLNQLPEAVHRQNSVLSALGNGISAPKAIAHYASSVYRVKVEDPQHELDKARARYKAATGFEALAFALADGSVPTTKRPAKEVPTGIANFLSLLTNGSTPEAAAAANGVNVFNEHQVRHYLATICREFDTKNLYVALRRAHEHGVVCGRTPKPPDRSICINRFTAPRQVGFTLPLREEGVALTLSELEVGRSLAAGLSTRDVAQECDITYETLKTHVRNTLKKLDAHNRAEMVAKLIVLGLADPPRKFLQLTGDVYTRQFSISTGIVQGLENAEIGKELVIAEDTVKTHLWRLSKRLGVSNRVAVVLCMFQTGIFKAQDTTDVPE